MSIEKKDVIELVSALVKIDSSNPWLVPGSPGEADVAAFIADWLKPLGVEVRLEEVEPGRWRRLVASPRPLRILEEEAIACLLAAGVVVIACGGGGIPVAWEGDRLVGVEGVIDKDFASSLLARGLGARKLIILTSVERVAVRATSISPRSFR